MDFFGLFNAGSVPAPSPEETERPLARLEQRIDLLLNSFGVSPPEPDTNALPADVQHFMNAGQKIEAIKRYRDHTGAGLAEAKAAVEEGHSTGSEASWQRLERKLDLVLNELGITPAEAVLPDTLSAFTAEINAPLRRNQVIQAIKRYREEKNVGLKEAKDAIDAWKRDFDAQR